LYLKRHVSRVLAERAAFSNLYGSAFLRRAHKKVTMIERFDPARMFD
jgi:hypothetical protein